MKKLFAIIMVVAMVASFISVVAAADDNVIARYTFSDNKADAGLKEHGNLTYSNGAVTFGEEGWLEATNVDVKGLNEITIAMKVKKPDTNSRDKGLWLYDITSDTEHSWGDGEHYFGLLFFDGGADVLRAQAFNNKGWRPFQASKTASELKDGYVSVVVTYTENHVLTLYVDGEVAETGEVTSEDFDYDLSAILGENPVVQFGKASWGANGEYSVGLTVSEYVIYNTALSAEAVAAITYADDPTGGTSNTVTAPKTGFATVALAIAAIGSGAYVVSKKKSH